MPATFVFHRWASGKQFHQLTTPPGWFSIALADVGTTRPVIIVAGQAIKRTSLR